MENEKIKMLKSKESYDFNDLLEIVEILRAPGGCPWDREQTHKSIRWNFVEEVYEACEAIDTDDKRLLCEELGDVLLQIALHSKISEETGEFTIEEVCGGICRKLIYRHPHVFADNDADTVDKVLENWDALKKEEKSRKSLSDEFDGVSTAFPALLRAEKVCKKVRKAGGENRERIAEDSFKNIDIILDGLKDSVKNEKTGADIIYKNFGKLLLETAKAADALGIEPEAALYEETERYIGECKLRGFEK